VQSDAGMLGAGERTVLALTDEGAGGLHLNLLDGAGRIVAGGDQDAPSPRPQLRHRAKSGERYALEVGRDAAADVAGAAPALVVAAVMDLDPAGETASAADGASTEGRGSDAAARPPAGPIVGERFEGRWRDGRADYGEEGRLSLVVAPDGTLSGTITSDSAGQEGAIRGRIDRASGAVEFRFAWRSAPKDAVTVRGRLWPGSGHDGVSGARLSGALTMTTSVGTTYAEAEADLKPG